MFNPLNAELNPICYLLALVGAHHILHVNRVRVKYYCIKDSLKSHQTHYFVKRTIFD